jgi:GT2 family glycosyltransferase
VWIRVHGAPVGRVEIPLEDGRADRERVLRALSPEARAAIERHLARDGVAIDGEVAVPTVPGPSACADRAAAPEPISVVLCSRDRPAQLASCLASLRRLAYERFEVVVVDNAPSDDLGAKAFDDAVGDDARFRYVVEPRPGLSAARNRGMAEATHDRVAFTDDDVFADRTWLLGIDRGFRRDARAGCVTGLVPSAQLETPYQSHFDERVWWSSKVDPERYDLSEAPRSPLFPFDAGRIGTGANFAVDRSLMRRLGGFDEALGAGSPTRGGEDLDAFVRILRAGRTIVYEPSAIVWHLHRTTFEELYRLLYGYGMGLSAYVTKYLAGADTRPAVLRRVPAGVRHMLGLWRRPSGRAPSDLRLVLAEVRGIAAGPLAYRRARAAGRRRPSPEPAGTVTR